MSKLTVKDFEGLSVPQLKKKLQETKDMDLLNQLEKDEERVTAKDAINQRQGELIDQQTAEQAKKDSLPPQAPPAPPAPPKKDDAAALAGDEQPVRDPNSDKPPFPIKEMEQKKADLIAEGAIREATEEDHANNREELIRRIKTARFRLDKQLVLVKEHLKIDTRPEQPLFLAKGWLGKLLGFVGANNPYEVKGGVKNVQDIPPTADKFEGNDARVEALQFGNKNALPAVLELRDELEQIISFIENLEFDFLKLEKPREASICRTQAWVNACEARFYLGEILSDLRPR